MELNANFSLAARPPAQKIGVAGWDAKVFSADSAPQLPPAPTPEQLLARPFPPEILRFYLRKRQAECIHLAGSVEGEQWSYRLHAPQPSVVVMPKAGDDAAEGAAVDAIARAEGSSDAGVRLAIAQVASANWHEFLRGVAGQAGAMSETPASCNSAAGNVTQANRPPTPQIPPLLQSLLTPAPEPAPVEKPRPAPGFAKEDQRHACAGIDPDDCLEARDWLREAADILQERGKQYDGEQQVGRERSMALIVAVFNALHGTALTVEQGWCFMLILKLVRLFAAGGFHRDSAVDAIAYMALLAEQKAQELRQGTKQ